MVLTTEDAVVLTRKTLESKDYVFETEYWGRPRTTVSIFKVPSRLIDEKLVYMLQFADHVT